MLLFDCHFLCGTASAKALRVHSVSLTSTDIRWMELRIAWNGDIMVVQWDVVVGCAEDRLPYFWIDQVG